MVLFEAAFLFLILALSHAQHDVSNPQIEVFPKGFRISIEDQPGITRVEFHVNLKRGHQNKYFFKNVQRKRDLRWAFTQRKVLMENGTIISYWLLVVKNRVTYRMDGGSFIVKELKNFHKPPKPHIMNQSKTTSCKTEAVTVPIALAHCENVILNTTQALIWIQLELEALLKTNQQLEKAIEKYPDAKKLTLSGRIPPDDDSMITVAFILWEKLDLRPNILSAVKNRDNSITFEVAKLSEKLEILDMAKSKLMNSKIFIF